jgi:hypothetical protein
MSNDAADKPTEQLDSSANPPVTPAEGKDAPPVVPMPLGMPLPLNATFPLQMPAGGVPGSANYNPQNAMMNMAMMMMMVQTQHIHCSDLPTPSFLANQTCSA